MGKETIMKFFLKKLINRNIWGGKHTEIKNITKGLPKHIRGIKAIKEFITAKMATGEIHITLNPRKKKEIYDLLNPEQSSSQPVSA